MLTQVIALVSSFRFSVGIFSPAMTEAPQVADSIEMPNLRGKAVVLPDNAEKKDLLSPEDGTTSQKRGGRGLPHVPSRTSSQRQLGSPTSTGLSGATTAAGDSRDSIGGHSKESKGSMALGGGGGISLGGIGRHRNGSASSQHSAQVVTGPTNTPGNSQPSSPAGSRQKKKKAGLLSLLGCCGVPDNANALDGDEPIPAHKLDKIPARPTTASRRTATPSEQTRESKSHLYEKDPHGAGPVAAGAAAGGAVALLQESSSKAGNRASASSTQDQSTVGDKEPESKGTTLVGSGSGPVVTVDPPNGVAGPAASDGPDRHDPHQQHGQYADHDASHRDGDGDIEMQDVDPAAAAQKQLQQQPPPPVDEQQQYQHQAIPLPPPPAPPQTPVPVPAVPENPAAVSPEQVPVKSLLPPISNEFKGRKCLVLDLDETLVHSSFKVCLERPS